MQINTYSYFLTYNPLSNKKENIASQSNWFHNPIFYLKPEETCKNTSNTNPELHYHIQKIFFDTLKDHIIKIPAIRTQLTIRLNKTITLANDETGFHFFIAEEDDNYIEKTPLLIFIKNELTTKNYSLESLVTKIKTVVPKKKQQSETYLNTLLSLGFLEFDYPVTVSDKNWMEQLSRFLYQNVTPSVKVKNIITLLNLLEKARVKMEIANNIAQQEKIQATAKQRLANFFKNF